jgi:beta-glucanase (GH16 family)
MKNNNIRIKDFKAIIIFVYVLLMSSCNTDETQTVATFDNLVINEEFSTDGNLDSSLWNIETGDGTAQGIPGWGNNELEYYTDRTENLSVENGYLLITARQESFNGSSYTSARIQTKNKFQTQFGRFEARMRLPNGQGMWPAFWLLGDDNNGTEIWPNIGEIDIMENRGQQPTTISGTVHGPGYSGGNSINKEFNFFDSRVDTDFHVYGVEWGENYINYYVDDVLYNQITPEDVTGEWVFNDRSFYIIINLAVGGDFVGNPNSETLFPQTMLIDYVKVYQQ